MKLLNLDELSQVTRKVKLFGKEYEVREMSVGAFIDSMKKATELERRIKAGEPIAPAEQMEAMVEAVKLGLPDCPIEELRKLSFDLLTTLIRFMNGDLDDDKGASEQKEGEPEKKS